LGASTAAIAPDSYWNQLARRTNNEMLTFLQLFEFSKLVVETVE
jgi:hypothetical protein